MNNALKILLLICAGEIIFSLPFHITRFFRPSFLNVFNLTNTQLGDMFSSYGFFAFLSYFPGGIIADKFQTKNLISLSLILTGLGGFYLYTGPSNIGLYALYGYWGITTILLFWAPLIKETKEWGADKHQGFAFGILDGGRGLVASFIATIILFFLKDQVSLGSFKNITLFYSTLTIMIGVLSYFVFKHKNEDVEKESKVDFSQILHVLKNQNIWLIGFIIIISYCGYKAIDNYGLYANKVLGLNEVDSSKFVTYTSYTRVFIAIAIGLLADRLKTSYVLGILFGVLALLLSLTPFIGKANLFIALGNLTITVLAIYGLRAIYFALIKECNIESSHTGTAVGIISVVGYTPDIFFASITGRILDSGSPEEGFFRYFITLGALSLLGLLAAVKVIKNNKIS